MEERRRTGTLLLLALVLGLGFGPGCSGEPERRNAEPAPDFELTSVDGDSVRLSDYRGEVVLIDFWATWCPPCRAAIPHFVELQKEYREDGLVVLGVSLDNNPEDLTQFLGRTTTNYPILKADDQIRVAYGGVSSVPQTFLVGRNGKIRQKYLGYDREIGHRMEKDLQALLREAPASAGTP